MDKGRITTQWKVYIAQHMNAKGITLKMQEWARDHTTSLWQCRSEGVHSRDTNQVDQFKIEALEREKDRIKNKHEELRHKIHEFQSRHLRSLLDIEQLHYNGQKCWAELARLYLDEAEKRIILIEATI
jgi:RPA family protein